MPRSLPFVVTLGLVSGCALKGDVRKVELQVAALQAERARADAERAAQIDSLRQLTLALQQALTAQQAYLVQLRGDMKTDLLAVQQQLLTVSELTGLSQQRLTELRGKIEEQARQPVPALDTTHAAGGPGAPHPPAPPRGDPPRPRPRQTSAPPLQQFRPRSVTTT